jgi:hypothetical protein
MPSFRITNSLSFADAVSRHIPGCLGGMEGLCSYRENIVLQKHDLRPYRPPESYPDPEAFAKDYDRYVRKVTRLDFPPPRP